MTLFQTILNEDLVATEELLRQGSNPNLVQFNGASAFHVAVGLDNLELSEDLTKLILQYDGDPNVRSSEGSTPVHTAAAFGHCENLRLLLLNGGDPFLVDQDGMDALANARESGCGLCCAIIRQHQQKLLEDLMKPRDTKSHYTITHYVPCEDHLPHASNSETSDPFVSPPHDQLCLGNTSLERPGSLTSYPCPWQVERETKVGQLWEEWQLGADRVSENSESSLSQGESRQEIGRLDKCLLEHSNSTGSHDSFYTCSDNGSVPEAVTKHPDSVQDSMACGIVSGAVALPDNEASGQQAVTNGRDRKSSPTTDSGDEYDLLGCALLDNSDRETGVTVSDESVASSSSFQLPSDYYSSSSDDDEDDSDSSSNHVVPPISEFSRLHLDVPCVRRELSVIDESQFTEDLCDEESRLMTEDETELESNVTGHSDRYAVWTRSVNDCCVRRDGANGGFITDGVAFCSPNENMQMNNICHSMVDVTPRYCIDSGVDVAQRHGVADSVDVTPRRGIVDVDVTPRHGMAGDDYQSVLTPETNGRNNSEETNAKSTPKRTKITSKQLLTEQCRTHGTHPQSSHYNLPKHDSHNRGRFALEHCHGAGDCPGMHSSHTDGPSKHNHLEKRLFRGCTQKYPERPGAYPPSDSSVISIRSVDSHVSLNSTVQYIYTDDEDGYSLLATRFLPNPPSGDRTELADIPSDILGLEDAELRSHLTSLGDVPGPITPGTRRLYQSRLDRLMKDPALADVQDVCHHEFLPELTHALSGQLDMSSMDGLEDLMSEPFVDPCVSRRWREGTLKTSFNYLLLDPRISLNLPARHKTMGELEAFRTFVRAVFYIGKGKRSRPYAHFKEAIQHLSGVTAMRCGAKVQRIVDVWEAGLGVISLHVFQNVIPVEAYTREACMLDAFGLERLTNMKGGEYYGPVTTWSRVQRRTLGVHLLYKAFRILLIEGERQIQPHHICTGQ